MSMSWTQVSFTLDRFIRLINSNLDELKNQHKIIVQLEKQQHHERAAHEKTTAKRLINQIQNALQQLLGFRAELDDNNKKQFDAKIEPIQKKITQTLSQIMPKLSTDQVSPTQASSLTDKCDNTPFKPTKSSNPFDENYFEDCFNDEELQKAASDYEQQLQVEVQKNYDSKRLEELKEKAIQARQDADAHKKLNQDIEDLGQIMLDLHHLVNSQGEMVDSIEDQVERTVTHVQDGHQQLKKAVRSKQAKYPLVAGLVGSLAAGGPVGVAAGSAVAGIAAAVGGAVAGLYGGRFLRAKVKEENE